MSSISEPDSLLRCQRRHQLKDSTAPRQAPILTVHILKAAGSSRWLRSGAGDVNHRVGGGPRYHLHTTNNEGRPEPAAPDHGIGRKPFRRTPDEAPLTLVAEHDGRVQLLHWGPESLRALGFDHRGRSQVNSHPAPLSGSLGRPDHSRRIRGAPQEIAEKSIHSALVNHEMLPSRSSIHARSRGSDATA
jgi:hypothetical protein